MRQKNEIRKLRKELNENAIDIKKFLIKYDLFEDVVLDLKISHKDLKLLIPDLRTVSYERIIKDKKILYTGDVVCVRDSFGVVIPYISPSLTDTIVYKVIDTKTDKYEIEIDKLISEQNLEIYQLEQICNKLKELRRFKEYKIVKRLLSKELSLKNKQSKQYKKEKRMLIERDREYEY